MKQEDLKRSFDRIEPDDEARQRMLNNILNYRNKKERNSFTRRFSYKVAVPALVLALVVTGSIMAYNLTNKGLWDGDFAERGKESTVERVTESDMAGNDLSGGTPEDSVAIIKNQFQIEDRHYVLLTDDMKARFSLPDSIRDSDIGKKITTITTTIDSDLLGCEVYEYLPAGCEAVVAVKIDNDYKLFRFFSFESYNNNEDEDAAAYLKLYGINSAGDISKIQFIGYSEKAKLENRMVLIGEITDSEEIAKFYNYYSVLKDSSKEYFDRLFNYRPADSGNIGRVPESKGGQEIEPGLVPPDLPQNSDFSRNNILTDEAGYVENLISSEGDVKNEPVTDKRSNIAHDTGNQVSGSGATSSAGSEGAIGDALGNPVTIMIYNRYGVYYETVYYPNIGFISRHKVTDEFADFLSRYIG